MIEGREFTKLSALVDKHIHSGGDYSIGYLAADIAMRAEAEEDKAQLLAIADRFRTAKRPDHAFPDMVMRALHR